MEEDYKTSEIIDMKDTRAVAYAAEQEDLRPGIYRNFAERSGTYNRKAITVYITKHVKTTKQKR